MENSTILVNTGDFFDRIFHHKPFISHSSIGATQSATGTNEGSSMRLTDNATTKDSNPKIVRSRRKSSASVS